MIKIVSGRVVSRLVDAAKQPPMSRILVIQETTGPNGEPGIIMSGGLSADAMRGVVEALAKFHNDAVLQQIADALGVKMP